VVGFTTGSRVKVPGKRKPMIREHHHHRHIIIIIVAIVTTTTAATQQQPGICRKGGKQKGCMENFHVAWIKD
jgi:hypothetical protein